MPRTSQSTRPLTLGELEALVPRLRATLDQAEHALKVLHDISGLLIGGMSAPRRGPGRPPSPKSTSTKAEKPATASKGGKRTRRGKKAAKDAEDQLSGFLHSIGKDGASAGEAETSTGLARSQVNAGLRKLRERGEAKLVGTKRNARWHVVA